MVNNLIGEEKFIENWKKNDPEIGINFSKTRNYHINMNLAETPVNWHT